MLIRKTLFKHKPVFETYFVWKLKSPYYHQSCRGHQNLSPWYDFPHLLEFKIKEAQSKKYFLEFKRKGILPWKWRGKCYLFKQSVRMCFTILILRCFWLCNNNFHREDVLPLGLASTPASWPMITVFKLQMKEKKEKKRKIHSMVSWPDVWVKSNKEPWNHPLLVRRTMSWTRQAVINDVVVTPNQVVTLLHYNH